MAEKISRTVTCPKCSQQIITELICSMNTESEPDMRESVMQDKFFDWKCEKCGFEIRLLHPLLYNDIKNRFMVYYIPKVERSRIVDEKLETEFSELSDIKKRLVPDTNSLREKILILENKIDDMAMELAKLAVSEIVEKSTGQTVYEGYFSDMDKSENNISFQFFVGTNHRPYLQTTRMEVYNRSLSIVERYFADEDTVSGFLNIDRSWAKDALQKYQETED